MTIKQNGYSGDSIVDANNHFTVYAILEGDKHGADDIKLREIVKQISGSEFIENHHTARIATQGTSSAQEGHSASSTEREAAIQNLRNQLRKESIQWQRKYV